MDFSKQLKSLFKPPERLHSTTAELSIRTGTCATPKDFLWMETNVPCQKACPAGTDIPAYLAALASGDSDEAYRINLRDNIFPAVLGRVCSRPCESACRHGYTGLGDPVSICFSKRSAANFKTAEPVLLDPWFPSSGKRVAVIGSGVAGLTAARNLTLFGHRVTVYEKHARPGGMLNQGIPEFRLPREIIDREIAQITGLGIEIVCNTTVGKEIQIDDLLEQFDAVVLAAGTLKPNLPELPGHELPEIRHGLDFLLDVNKGRNVDLGKNVIVIGGGFTAMDCARTARRLGAQTSEFDLQVLYRRTRKDMRVTPGELEELDEEGIPLECHATPIAYLKTNGSLSGMRFRRTGTEEEFDIPANTVLLATGQVPDPTGLGKSADKIFRIGDFSTGASSLIDAIGDAKKKVEKVDLFLMGNQRLVTSVRVEMAKTTGRDQAMDSIVRQPMPTLPAGGRDLPSEVELGHDKNAATEEAKRCYQCHYKFEIDQDQCIKCDWCLKAKPRSECILMLKNIEHDAGGRAISWAVAESVRDMNLIWINPDECIRCGACIKACPVDAIHLQKVSLFTEHAIKDTAVHTEKKP